MTEPAAYDDFLPAPGIAAASTGQDREQPAEPLFQDQTSPQMIATPAPVGPGMWEALLWIIGFIVVEITGNIIGALVGAVWRVATGQPVSPMSPDFMTELLPWMLGVSKALEVVAVLAAIRLRYGFGAFRLTGFRRVPAVHLGVLCFAILPTAFVSGQLYALFQQYWDKLAEHAPRLQEFEKFSSIETVQAMTETTPLAILVLIIAVLPALNEEFLCRVAIGRGLVGRYGVIAGIALTSMLFAAMHLSPVHAAALVPLAVVLHVGYLSSRSIWWPVIVHFLNNAMSVVLMKYASEAAEQGGLPAELAETSFSPLLFLASLACVVTTVWLLWKMRVKWLLEDGQVWEPTPAGVDPPPLAGVPFVPSPPALVVLLACLSYLLFPVALVVSIWLTRAA